LDKRSKEAKNCTKQKKDEIFSKYCDEANNILQPLIGELTENGMKKLRSYVDGIGRDSGLVAHRLPDFKSDFEKMLTSWKQSQESDAKVKIYSEEISPEIKHKEYEKEILYEARTAAEKLKEQKKQERLDDSEIKRAFEKLYRVWMSKAKSEDAQNMGQIDGCFDKIHRDTLKSLNTKLEQLQLKNESEKYITTAEIEMVRKAKSDSALFQIEIDKNTDISCHWKYKLHPLAPSFDTNKFKQMMETIENELQEELRKHESQLNCDSVVGNILDITQNKMNTKIFDIYELKKNFKRKVFVRVFLVSVKKLAHLSQTSLEKCSLVIYLEKFQSKLFQTFKDECLAADSDGRAAARFVNGILTPILVDQVKHSIGCDIEKKLKTKELHSKTTMLYHMHKELLQLPLSNSIDFTNNFEHYIKNWIKKKAIKICQENDFLAGIVTKKIRSDIIVAVQVLGLLAEKATQEKMRPDTWWTYLKAKLREKSLSFMVISFLNVDHSS
jgi:hypothetical protein